MLFGKHEPRSSGARRRETFEPRAEGLEERVVLSVADLANVATQPYGVQLAGNSLGAGAGYSVAVMNDVNRDGFQDTLVGAPGLALAVGGATTLAGVAQDFNQPGMPFLAGGTGGTGTVYLTFGSNSAATNSASPFQNLATPGQRTGELTQLGTTPQVNPAIAGTTPTAGFPFNGLKIKTGLNSGPDGLGVSVADAGVIVTTGANANLDSFLLGAPAANRAYLVIGSPSLDPVANTPSATATLTLNAPFAGVNVVTFTGPIGSQVGRNVADVGTIFNDGVNYIAITAPTYSPTGTIFGEVFLLPAPYLAGLGTATVDLTKVGVTGSGVPGYVLTDPYAPPLINFTHSIAVSTVSSFDGTGNLSLLVGLPDAQNGSGQADVIYGGAALATLLNAAPNHTVDLGTVGTAALPGAAFTGTDANEAAGYAVSSAGDFNSDGIGDILIGSPGYRTDQGRATLIYGRTTNGPILGTYSLGSLNTGTGVALVKATTFVGYDNNNDKGASANPVNNALAGFSLGVTFGSRAILTKNPDILIGSPGANLTPRATTAGQGVVYLIPPNTALPALVSLSLGTGGTIQTAPVGALVIGDTSTIDQSFPATTPPLGTQVGVSIASSPQPLAGNTVDSDTVPDLAVGAPLSNLTTNAFGANQAGSLFILEGAFLTGLGAGGGGGGGTGTGSGGSVPTTSTNGVNNAGPPVVPISTSQIAPGTPFGPDRWSPPLADFSQYNYVPIPLKVAYAQYYPSAAFQQRIRNYYNPPHVHNQFNAKGGHNTHGNVTLSQSVFNRTHYKTGHVVQFTHNVPVVPVQRQTERFAPANAPNVARKKK